MKKSMIEQFELPCVAAVPSRWAKRVHVDETAKLEAWLSGRRVRWSATPLEVLLGEFWAAWALSRRVKMVRLPKSAVPPKAKRVKVKKEKKAKAPKTPKVKLPAWQKRVAKLHEKGVGDLDPKWAAWGKAVVTGVEETAEEKQIRLAEQYSARREERLMADLEAAA